MKTITIFPRLILCTMLIASSIVTYAGTQKKASGVKEAKVVPVQIKTAEQPGAKSPRTQIKIISEAPHLSSSQSASGGDLVVGAGANLILKQGTGVSLGGNFSNSGTFTAGTPTTVNFDGNGPQTLNGATSFDNLEKSGGGTLTLASPITVNNALNVLDGSIDTGPDSISFGPNGTLNGESAGGRIIKHDTVLTLTSVSFIAQMTSGWNLLSVPLEATDFRRTAIFPTANSSAYAYMNGYHIQDTLQNGVGYWLKFPSGSPVTVYGYNRFRDTVSVNSRWNMIGGLSRPFPASDVVGLGTTILSPFYGYNAGYQPADTLKPAAGYWIKVSSAGNLIIATPGLSTAPKTAATPQVDLQTFNSLLIEDNEGRKQKLFVGAGTEQIRKIVSERYELPPSSPAGTFDVRFASQQMVETYPAQFEKPQEFQINLNAAVYPLTLQWDAAKGSKENFTLSSTVDGRILNTTSLKQSGSMKIVNSHVSSLLLRVQSGPQIPSVFALEQNYPNPFNPSTVIQYQLMLDSRVSLRIYNVLGQEVRTLVNEVQEAGYKSVEFDGGSVASGVYFYRLDATSVESKGASFTSVKKMLMIK